MAKVAKRMKSKAKKAPARRKVKAVASVKRAGVARRAKAKKHAGRKVARKARKA